MTIASSTTVEQLAALVENYYGLTKRINKLGKTLEVTEKLILDAFDITGMKTFTTPSGLCASILFTQAEIGEWKFVLRVSQTEAEKPTVDRLLDTNIHFQNQG